GAASAGPAGGPAAPVAGGYGGVARRRPSLRTAGSCRTSPRRCSARTAMADFEFAILGAGAMGSLIGAHLARAGHTVAMLARGERARQLEERGLAIRGLAEFSTPVRTLRDPAALESAGTLIVATKTPGTAQALE